jgi:hypothetical protein
VQAPGNCAARTGSVAAINRDLQVRAITAIPAGGACTFLDIYKRVLRRTCRRRVRHNVWYIHVSVHGFQQPSEGPCPRYRADELGFFIENSRRAFLQRYAILKV